MAPQLHSQCLESHTCSSHAGLLVSQSWLRLYCSVYQEDSAVKYWSENLLIQKDWITTKWPWFFWPETMQEIPLFPHPKNKRETKRFKHKSLTFSSCATSLSILLAFLRPILLSKSLVSPCDSRFNFIGDSRECQSPIKLSPNRTPSVIQYHMLSHKIIYVLPTMNGYVEPWNHTHVAIL